MKWTTVILIAVMSLAAAGSWRLYNGGSSSPQDHSRATPVVANPAPSALPANQVSLVSAGTMPDDFSVLTTRNIFSRSRPAPPPTFTFTTSAPRAGVGHVVRGITEQDGRFTAMVEDISTGKFHTLQPGDRIAAGRVRAISFDGLQFEPDEGPGKSNSRVEIGQALDGTTAPRAVWANAQPVKPKQPAGQPDQPPQQVILNGGSWSVDISQAAFNGYSGRLQFDMGVQQKTDEALLEAAQHKRIQSGIKFISNTMP